MVWGVTPLLVLNLTSTSETIQASISTAQEQGLVAEGDLVVITAGTLQGVSGSTDLIKIEIVTAVMGQGTGIGQGSVSGCARVAHTSTELKNFNRGEILVAARTEASYVEAMRKAGGIITEDARMDSHAAVLGLRLGIPVIVGVKNATQIIRDGTMLTLDVRRGLVYSGRNNSHHQTSGLKRK
jgi:pyruvate kinase